MSIKARSFARTRSTWIIKPSKLGSQTEAINENQRIHFSSRGKCLSKAHENLQYLASNWVLRSKSKDIWKETLWMQGLAHNF
jgi:hypothetical protein